MTDSWRSRIVRRADVAPAELVANEKNWRRHPRAQREALAGVLGDVGWVQDVVVNARTGRIVDGHLRAELARKHGEATVPVVYVDLDEREEALILATFDPLGAAAGIDEEALSRLLETVEAESAAVRELLAGLAAPTPPVDTTGGGDPDTSPPIPTQTVSSPGDLWILDANRLLVGDATDGSAVERVMGGARARWVWTDPPYGVGYTGRTAEALTLDNDTPERLEELLRGAFEAADLVLLPGAPVYVAAPSGPQLLTFGAAIGALDWHLHQILAWVKDAFVLGHSDFHYQHELVLYAWKRGRRPWFAGRDQSSVLQVARPRRSPEHPTQKPVELIERLLACSATRGDRGLDPFLGSGTTLIAGQRLCLPVHGIEIDPRHADVAIRRWQEFTGRQARLDDGRTFADVSEARGGG
ncbi:MAG: DNA modification methylase [Verrucomicrobiales bacterium]|nr:DNA modification methylase [Verrucomicrobiales bacterium]